MWKFHHVFPIMRFLIHVTERVQSHDKFKPMKITKDNRSL